jgi:vacuolar-type H+-ATPase subunit H
MQASLKVTHGIADLTKELQQTRECYQREIATLKEKHETDIEDVRGKAAEELKEAFDQLEELKAACAQEVGRCIPLSRG